MSETRTRASPSPEPRAPTDGTAAYVMLSPSGTRFAWWRVDNSHPAVGIEGTARRIATFVREHARGPGTDS